MLAATASPTRVAATDVTFTDVTFKAEINLKETYDSNVYIQDNDPDPKNVAAAKAVGLRPVEANKGSLVTSVLPRIGLNYKPFAAFGLSATYASDAVFYHSANSEDYVTHRGMIDFGGKVGDASWELTNTATYIDGSREGPTFAQPDEIPAIGGIPLRDRRAAFVFRNSFRLTEPVGDWFFRPVAASYIHDFKTRQLFVPSTQYTYENYISRQDVSGGLDVGYRVLEGLHVLVGYRYGRQDQFKGFEKEGTSVKFVDSPYSNSYSRILVGVEGSPASWVKLAVLFGPDIRTWDDSARLRSGPYAAFNQNKLLYYWDASATFLPTENDTVTLKSLRYEQPAFSSFSMYEDIKTDLAWQHQLRGHLTASAGFTLYIGDWQQPVNRDDWIYTPNASLKYAFTQNLSAEVTYSYDWVDSKVSASREFTRHLATLGVKYAL